MADESRGCNDCAAQVYNASKDAGSAVGKATGY